MRVIVLVLVLVLCGVANAEPSGSVGLRTTWNTQLEPPSWLMTGGQWGLRVGRGTWLRLDADGMRGDVYERYNLTDSASQRTMLAAGFGPVQDVMTRGHNALRVLGGVGVGVEWSHQRMLGDWYTEDTSWRSLAYVGAAFEHRFRPTHGKGGAIGVELRGVRLFGRSADSMAPALSAYSLQASLSIDAYFL